jgi:dehydrogenase/reductase SDR family protein 4
MTFSTAFLLTKEVVPHMEGRKGASIVYISSIAGFQPFAVRPVRYNFSKYKKNLIFVIKQILGPYSVSKTALLGLTKVMAQELGPEIRVNCVCPGIIRTRFSAGVNNFITDVNSCSYI